MPYFDAPPIDVQRSFEIDDDVKPDAAVIVGQFSQRAYFARIRGIWPDAREVEEHSLLVEESGLHVWISVVFGAAMAATMAHLAVKLGARALVQIGAIGGLVEGWRTGEVFVPSLVVGRDGVSRQLTRNKPITPDVRLTSALEREIATRIGATRSGTLVSTTTISLERPSDIARWRRSGYAGVEMECAASMGTAAYFGVRTAAAFVLMDNLADHQTVLTLSRDDERRIESGKDAILRAAAVVLSDLRPSDFAASSPGSSPRETRW